MGFGLAVGSRLTEVMVDAASLKILKIVSNPKWKEEANERIRLIRRGTITIK